MLKNTNLSSVYCKVQINSLNQRYFSMMSECYRDNEGKFGVVSVIKEAFLFDLSGAHRQDEQIVLSIQLFGVCNGDSVEGEGLFKRPSIFNMRRSNTSNGLNSMNEILVGELLINLPSLSFPKISGIHSILNNNKKHPQRKDSQ